MSSRQRLQLPGQEELPVSQLVLQLFWKVHHLWVFHLLFHLP